MADVEDGMVLDLSNANLKGIEALPSGPYPASIYDVDPITVKEDSEGKLPPGTPGIKVQFKIDEDAVDGETRYQWTNYWFLPADYDEKKKKDSEGFLARFLMAVGYGEQEITSGKFKLKADDLIGRECTIVLGQEKSYLDPEVMQNVVKSVRARSANLEDAGVI